MPSPFKSLQLLIAACLCFFLAVPASIALSPQDLPAQPPDKAVLDSADVLSRAGKNEIETRLNQLESSKVDARVITVRKLDYGLSLTGFGENWLNVGRITATRLSVLSFFFLKKLRTNKLRLLSQQS